MVCPQCHVSNPPGAASCGKCSTPFGLDIATVYGPVEDFVSQTRSEDDAGVGQVATVWSQLPEQLGPKSQVSVLPGTVLAGRNIGLFQADAILNDMTLLGVGANQSNAAPTNTSLGSKRSSV